MAGSGAERTILCNNQIGAKEGDEVVFIMPDLLGDTFRIKNIIPLLISLLTFAIIYGILSKFMNSTALVFGLALLASLCLYFLSRGILSKATGDNSKTDFSVKIIEVIDYK